MDTAKLEVVPGPASAAPSSTRASGTDRALERLAKAQAEVKAAQRIKRAALNRQAAIVGRAVIAELLRSPEFRRTAIALLRRSVTRPADRAEIAPLLIDPTP